MASILLVDDEASDLRLMQDALARAGYETVTASSGEEALRTYRKNDIDLVITDLQMGDLHGLELISIFSDFTPPPRVIAVSATGSFHLDMAGSLGARWTLLKPVDPQLLVRAVKRALENVEDATSLGSG